MAEREAGMQPVLAEVLAAIRVDLAAAELALARRVKDLGYSLGMQEAVRPTFSSIQLLSGVWELWQQRAGALPQRVVEQIESLVWPVQRLTKHHLGRSDILRYYAQLTDGPASLTRDASTAEPKLEGFLSTEQSVRAKAAVDQLAATATQIARESRRRRRRQVIGGTLTAVATGAAGSFIITPNLPWEATPSTNTSTTIGADAAQAGSSSSASAQPNLTTSASIATPGATPTTSGAATTTSPAPQPGVIGFKGGCTPFQVFAQNRWNPYGAAIRTAPNVLSKQISNRDPNQSFAVSGWVHGPVAYRTNTAPWNNNVWFFLADGDGWVSFAGVRAQPVGRDPSGLSKDGGVPVPLKPSCQGSAQ